MKPSKTKLKKDLSEKTAKIQDYFKTEQKEVVTEERFSNFDNKAFYIQALKDKLNKYNAEVERASHTNETDLRSQEEGASAVVQATGSGETDLSQEVDSSAVVLAIGSGTCDGCKQKALEAQEWERKYKEIKRTYLKLSVRYTELDMKHGDLLKTATTTFHSDIDDAVVSTDEVFTLNETRCLQSIPLDKAKDSNFILQCIQYAYKANPSVLLSRTLKGTQEWMEIEDDGNQKLHPAKDPLTPKKVNRIKELFIERVSKCNTNSVEYGERMKSSNINKLFASAIKNVAKKKKKVQMYKSKFCK